MKEQIHSTVSFVLFCLFIIIGWLYIDQVQKSDVLENENIALKVTIQNQDRINAINTARFDSINISNERYAEVFQNLKKNYK